MLRQDKLDDLSFQQIVDRARIKINDYYPEWTDQNMHDPGIMLIELFAWLTEMQQFYLDQSEDAEAALPLLGINRCHTAPATANVKAKVGVGSEKIIIPKGTPLLAEEVQFETVEPFINRAVEIAGVVTCEGEWGMENLTVLYPFGRNPQAGNCFTILLSTPCEVDCEQTLELFFYIPAPGRTSVDPLCPPQLAVLQWDYLSTDGYIRLKVVDGTYSLITNGVIRFKLHEPMAQNKDGLYELRCTLISHQYEISPCIEALQPDVFTVRQKRTVYEDVICEVEGNVLTPATYLAEAGESMIFDEVDGVYTRINDFTRSDDSNGFTHFTIDYRSGKPPTAQHYHVLSCLQANAHGSRILGEAEGFPNQSFVVDIKDERLLYDEFSLLIAEDYLISRATKWNKVNNFYCSSPTDLHYTLDEQSGKICFGDGINGAMPKGIIIIASMAFTCGEDGNIAPKMLTELAYKNKTIKLEQSIAASGGSKKESTADAIVRSRRRIERAVTAEDFAELVSKAPGLMIEKVTAYAGNMNPENTFEPYRVVVAVKPYGHLARLSAAYREYIRTYLEPFRLAGSEIEVVSPNYVRVDITAEITVYPRSFGIEAVLETGMKEFFTRNYSGFGTEIRRSALRAALAALPNVESLISLSVHSFSSYAHEDLRGNITLEQNALAYWGTFNLMIS